MATVFDDPAYPYHIHITANVGEQVDLTFGQIFGAANATRAWTTNNTLPAGLAVNSVMQTIEGTPTTPVENSLAYFTATGATARTLSFDILAVTEPDPEPLPVEGEHFLAPRLAAFLGRPNDPETLAQADSHLPIVQSFVEGYTRGNGFDAEGRPVYALQNVIISAAARLAANPEQVSWYAIGDYSERPAVLSGYTLPEIGILHRYRRRSGSIGLASTVSTGSTGSTGGGTVVPGADLTGYATLEYVDQRIAGLDLSSYASQAYVQTYVAQNAPQPDLTPYATRTYVDNKVAGIPSPDLSAYASRTYVDNKVAGIPAPDLSGYATKSELTSYATDAELSSAIEAIPPTDLTGYATETYVDDAIAAIPPSSGGGGTLTTEVFTAMPSAAGTGKITTQVRNGLVVIQCDWTAGGTGTTLQSLPTTVPVPPYAVLAFAAAHDSADSCLLELAAGTRNLRYIAGTSGVRYIGTLTYMA